MKRLPVLAALWCLLLGGCATLPAPSGGVYPFRAAFVGSGMIEGGSVSFEGALSITSPEQGFAQVYGPGGLAAYSVNVTRGEVKVYDMWGRLVSEYSVPLDQFMGLIAGMPPGMRYLWRRSADGLTSVTDTWGRLVIDERRLPRELHLRGEPGITVNFVEEKGTITLLINRGSDRLRLDLDITRGGRWAHRPFMQ